MNQSPYDETPFVSRPSPERHISRLWWLGRLRGISTVPISKARVLELGSANGRNLIAMAEFLPNSTFIGVDNSSEQIKEGEELVQKCDLKNVEFRTEDLLEFSPEAKSFDYIICHGIYSWVDPSVQSRIFEIVAEALSSSGIAYISHNTLPGWGVRKTVKDILELFDDPKLSTEVRVKRARDVLDHTAGRLVDAFRPYGVQLKEEIERNLKRSDSFLVHELLAPNASASTLSDIISEAQKFDLHYIGDAHPRRMQSFDKYQDELPEEFSSTEEVSAHYLDLLHPTSFRGSLWAKGLEDEREGIDIRAINECYLASPLVYQSDEHDEKEFHEFSMIPFYGPEEEVIEAKAPALKLLLKNLCDRWPATSSYSELIEDLKKEISFIDGEEESLQRELVSIYFRNLLDVYPESLPVRSTLEGNPTVPIVARVSQKGGWVTSLRHEVFKTDTLDLLLLPLVDGKRSEKELVELAVNAVRSGDLRMEVEGEVMTGESKDLEQFISLAVSERLSHYLEQAMLTV